MYNRHILYLQIVTPRFWKILEMKLNIWVKTLVAITISPMMPNLISLHRTKRLATYRRIWRQC